MQTIYLISSNASKEYILDALEVLSLPFGMVQHFRYQLKWLDKELKEELPLKDNSKKDSLKNYKVVICYLYQEKIDNGWEWIKIYPVRTGVLMDAYKTGEKEEDIAHFYFKVDAYIPSDKGNEIEKEIKKWRKVWNKTYAFFGKSLKNNILTSKKESYSIFHNICTSFKKEHFKSPEGNTEYYPIFCLIEGLKTFKRRCWRKIKKTLTPEYNSLSHKSYYKIDEGSYCSFEFRIFSPENPPEFQIVLKSDEKLFSTPSKYELRISSRYTEESCALISRFLERDVFTLLCFETTCKNFDKKEPLNFHIDFPVKIKRNLFFRIVEVAGDIGFGVGTASIALSKVLGEQWSWWYWPVIGGYLTWMICKLIVKLLWRG